MTKRTGRKKGPKGWPEDQVERLRELAGKWSPKEIAFVLNRSVDAVWAKSRQQGINLHVPSGCREIHVVYKRRFNRQRMPPPSRPKPVQRDPRSVVDLMMELSERVSRGR